MLKSHYAPRVPLSVHESIFGIPADENCAYLFFDGASRDKWLSFNEWLSSKRLSPMPPPEQKPPVKVLSETGNLTEAAARLFEALHELDQLAVKHIYAQRAPEEGLGIAINDRLCRASAKAESAKAVSVKNGN
jgi:L-threonylcarbamoyladenylate synthase